ncbi:hypothetical protein LJC63_09000, partial [Ruminococcaceae bacterium OttesenSCG-928-L11]|nr:hypothetical protein [Ruminococcaceae bacterium OttesenSCG-928-L11]
KKQQPDDDMLYMPPTREPERPSEPPLPGHGGKKSSEELLMELAAQTKAAEERLRRNGSAGMSLNPTEETDRATRQMQQMQRMEVAQARQPRIPVAVEKKKRRFHPRIVIPSALVATVVLCLVLLAVTNKLGIELGRLPALVNSAAATGDGDPEQSTAAGETVTIYETRTNSSGRAQATDAMIKRSGISVANMSVENLMVLSDIDSQGAVTLQDVDVGGSIHVKTSALNELILTDVQTPRLIVSNADAHMLVRVSGNSSIGVLEIKTDTNVEQSGLSADAPGVQLVTVKADAAGSSITAGLTGLNTPVLTAEGETVLRFGDTRVDSLTADGSLSIEGTGRIGILAVNTSSVAAAAARGTLDWGSALQPMTVPSQQPAEATPTAALNALQVRVKGVSVATMNVKAPGDFVLNTDVDFIATADPISISGSGTIGNLTVNERFGNSRLQIGLTDVNVLSMICEAQTRIDCTGSAKINDLVCNASVYALGNKVNTLRVNDDDVVYQREPDNIVVASGVHPPYTTTERPNLNLDLPSATGGTTDSPDEEDDDVSTTCGHTRQSGGFLAGDGSKDSPFQVENAAQLAHVTQHLDSYFLQTADIDIADHSEFAGSFPAIAASGTAFTGVYDGQGHVLRNLRIISDREQVGLFAANSGVIRNLHILSGEVNGSVNSGAYVGAIAGVNYENGQITSCSNRAKVTGKASYVGGIVGYNYGGRIRDCYTAAKITADTHAGGIVGVNRSGGSLAGCYNAGTIDAGDPAGAICGLNEAKITNCYYLEDTAEFGIGQGDGSAEMRTTEELASSQMVDDLAAGNDTSLWTRGSTLSNEYQYPMLDSPPQAG